MATIHKIYSKTGVTTIDDFFVIASGESVTVSKIVIHNPNGAAQTFTMTVNTNVLYEIEVPTKDTFIIGGPLLLKYLDTIKVTSTDSTMTFTAFTLLTT
jgi:hypothetical protein